jgi:hypothetical protein
VGHGSIFEKLMGICEYYTGWKMLSRGDDPSKIKSFDVKFYFVSQLAPPVYSRVSLAFATFPFENSRMLPFVVFPRQTIDLPLFIPMKF